MPTPPTDSFDMSTATPVAAGSLVSADRIGIVDMSGPTPVVATLGEFIKFYISPVSGIVKSNGSTLSAAVAGTDYLAPTGSGAGLTGITVSQVSGALAAANNLSDVADVPAAAANLGLGTGDNVTFQSVSSTFSGDGSGLTGLNPGSLSGPVGVGFGGLGASNAASTGVPLFTAGVVTIVATSGTGNFIRATSPTLVTPALGTPSALVLTNATGLPISGLSATGTPSSSTFLRGDNTWATPAGGGNVSNVGTPTSGQIAEWTGATTVQGVAVTGSGSVVRAGSPTLTGTLTVSSGGNTALLDGTTIYAFNGTGQVTLSPGGTAYAASLAWGSPLGGVQANLLANSAGTPMIGLSALGLTPNAMIDLEAYAKTDTGFNFKGVSGQVGYPIRVAQYDDTAVFLVDPDGVITGVGTNITGIPVGGLSATGTPSSSTYLRGDNTWATPGGGGTVTSITLTQPAAGLTITGSGVAITSSGTPTFALANDLAAVEGLAGTGLAVRTAADTWATRTLTGTTNRVSVSNGDGVSGNPTIDIDAAYAGQATITTLGTVTTGTWAGQNVTATAASGTSAVRVSSPDATRQAALTAANLSGPSLSVTTAAGTSSLLLYTTTAGDVGFSSGSGLTGQFEFISQSVVSSTPVVVVSRLSSLTIDGDNTGPVFDTPGSVPIRFTLGGTEICRAGGTGFRVSSAGLLLLDQGGTKTTAIKINETNTGNRTLNLTVNNANRAVSLSGDLTVSATATVSGTNTGDQTSVTGNAGTATALQTARNINGVSFNGTADITVTAAAGTLTGTTLASNVVTSSLTTVGTIGAGVWQGTAVGVAYGGSGATTAVGARAAYGFVTLTTTATSGTVTIDCSAADITYVLSLTNNVTLALSNEADGRRFTLFVRGQASGYTITWFSGIKWVGGAAPTIPTVSGRVMAISFIRLGSGEWVGLPASEAY